MTEAAGDAGGDAIGSSSSGEVEKEEGPQSQSSRLAGGGGGAAGADKDRAAGPAPSFDVGEANRTLHLAWSTFCDRAAVTSRSCGWCAGPHAYGADDLEVRPGWYLEDEGAGTRGYVALDRGRGRVVVAYRGSDNVQNTLQDQSFWFRGLPFGPSGRNLRVHA